MTHQHLRHRLTKTAIADDERRALRRLIWPVELLFPCRPRKFKFLRQQQQEWRSRHGNRDDGAEQTGSARCNQQSALRLMKKHECEFTALTEKKAKRKSLFLFHSEQAGQAEANSNLCNTQHPSDPE